MRIGKTVAILGLAMVCTLGTAAWSQNATPPTRQNQAGGRGGNRADWRARMTDRYKEMLGASDDEWKIIGPRLEKVQQLSMSSRMSGMGMMFRRGGNGGPGGRGAAGPGGQRGAAGNDANRPQPPAEVAEMMQKTQELRSLLDAKDSDAGQIKAKLAALREAREKSKKDLAAAQQQLRDVVTLRQEAVLVMLGLLD